MGLNYDKYYEKLPNGKRELLPKYLLSYVFRRGFSGIEEDCPIINLYIDQDHYFEVYFVWSVFPNPKLMENYLTDPLPSHLVDLLNEIDAFESLDLKDSYLETDYIYIPDGAQLEQLSLCHRGERFHIDFSPYGFKKALMITDQEKKILELYETIDLWMKELFNDVKQKH